jgi:RNA polymerase sigma factor (sigma-70 family)
MAPAALSRNQAVSSETDLISAARNGDRSAFESIYRRHVNRIHALCLRLCGDADLAEQLVQDAFVRAWLKLPAFRGQSGFGTWMHRLTVNLVLDRQRTRARRKRREMTMDPLSDPPATALDMSIPSAPIGERIDLEHALTLLADGARTAFVLYEIEGHGIREIATLMRVSEGTVKTQLFRARNRLREVLR